MSKFFEQFKSFRKSGDDEELNFVRYKNERYQRSRSEVSSPRLESSLSYDVVSPDPLVPMEDDSLNNTSNLMKTQMYLSHWRKLLRILIHKIQALI